MFYVPGLINLHEQSRLSLNFLQGAVDYWQNGLPYFNIKYDQPGARFQHNHWDQSENIGRVLYATVLARIICGIQSELPLEKCWKQLIYQSIPEGSCLSHRPNPSPYDISAGARDEAAEQVGVSQKPVLEADLWDNRSIFTALMLSYENTGDAKAFEVVRKMLQQLKGLAYWEHDCAYFKFMSRSLGCDQSNFSDNPIMGQNMGGWISPLVHYFKLTGDESSLHLAKGLGRSFLTVYPKTLFATAKTIDPILAMNSHSLYFMLAGLVRLYRVTWEREFVEWAKWQFDGMLKHLCSETGWTQEFMPFQQHKGGESCETCSLADRIDTDIQLALAGYSEYWNDAQRCACNYMREAQLTDSSWMPLAGNVQDDFFISTYHIPERSLGAYVGWGAPNDFVDESSRAPGRIQNCCGAHGVFGCYQLWHYAIQKNSEGIAVNLDISRDSSWCSVLTHAPVQGKIDIKMKIDSPLSIRLPDWVKADEITVTDSGEACDFNFAGGFVKTAGSKGHTLIIEYPMQSKTKTEMLSGKPYTTFWTDDYVLSIEPKGTRVPLYQRDVKLIGESYSKEIVWPPLIKEIEW